MKCANIIIKLANMYMQVTYTNNIIFMDSVKIRLNGCKSLFQIQIRNFISQI